MGLDIKLNKKNIVPDENLLVDMGITGIFAAFVAFILDFFGITILTDYLPKGLEVLVVVAASVYIKNLIDAKLDGKKLF